MVADLPQIPGRQVCYNFVLGRCAQNGCQNKEGDVNVADLPDDFVILLLDSFQPAIRHFLEAGPPAQRVYNCRHRRDE